MKPDNVSKNDGKVYGPEEDEAMRRDPVADLETFHSSCEFIKSCIANIKDVKKADKDSSQEIQAIHTDAVIQFIEMKKINRLAHFRCRKAREGTNDAKHKIDQCHLTLQNLLYEVMHLQKEITKCMEFKSKDEEIELVSVDDFYKNAPESVSNPAVTKKDDHLQTLARLEWELEQRKELAVKLKEMEASKEKITQDIKSKEEYLETLQPKLSAILAATRPVQDYLDIPYNAIREEHRKAQHLAPPLYVLYMQLSAYKDACDNQLKVSIEGDVETAKTLAGQNLELDDDSDSDQDELDLSESKRRRKTIEARRIEKKDQILRKHPLTVVLEICLAEEGATLHLTFNSLLALTILTVNVRVTLGSTLSTNSISGGDLLSPDLLLDELYPGDYGNDSPNVANHYELSRYGLQDLCTYITTVGRPYLWCQWLGGLQFLTKDIAKAGSSKMSSGQGSDGRDGDEGQTEREEEDRGLGKDSGKDTALLEMVQAKHSVSSSHMEETIRRLKKRLRARMTLVTLISSIERGIIPLPQELLRLFPAKINAKLGAWRRSTFEDLRVLKQAERAIKAGVIRQSDFIYTVSVERGSAKLTAFVVFSADCPMVAPYFVLDLVWQFHRTALNDIHIMEMEEELNLHYDELIQGKLSRDFLLTTQLYRLLMCLDVYLETEGNSSSILPLEFPAEKVLPRTMRGRSRSKPYKYVPELGIFTQRL